MLSDDYLGPESAEHTSLNIGHARWWNAIGIVDRVIIDTSLRMAGKTVLLEQIPSLGRRTRFLLFVARLGVLARLEHELAVFRVLLDVFLLLLIDLL